MEEQKLIHDWNTASEIRFVPTRPIEFDDETLRDGLQSPSVVDPDIEQKIEILHLMEELGIHIADIGLPGAGPRAREHVLALAREIADNRLNIAADCAARTIKADITPIVEISQKVGMSIEVSTFIGSSPIRQYAEEWTLDRMLRHTEEAVSYIVKNNLPVMYVTEDTTRSDKETIRRLYTTAIECGARRICVCDTVGHANPRGVRNLLAFVREIIRDTGEDVKIDWHGHRDRALSVPNTIEAIESGADRVHGTAIGIGERVGNTPMDLLLVNLRLLGWIDNDLRALPRYCEAVARACGVEIPSRYPVLGRDAFRTATGVHAAAVIKAQKKGDAWLADRIYSGVPASMVGRVQGVEIGPMSGESNVIYWLNQHGIEATEETIGKVFKRAKSSPHLLSDEEIYASLGIDRNTSDD